MTQSLITTDDYKAFTQDIKQRSQALQVKAPVSVNQELLGLNGALAEHIVIKQQEST